MAAMSCPGHVSPSLSMQVRVLFDLRISCKMHDGGCPTSASTCVEVRTRKAYFVGHYNCSVVVGASEM